MVVLQSIVLPTTGFVLLFPIVIRMFRLPLFFAQALLAIDHYARLVTEIALAYTVLEPLPILCRNWQHGRGASYMLLQRPGIPPGRLLLSVWEPAGQAAHLTRLRRSLMQPLYSPRQESWCLPLSRLSERVAGWSVAAYI